MNTLLKRFKFMGLSAKLGSVGWYVCMYAHKSRGRNVLTTTTTVSYWNEEHEI